MLKKDINPLKTPLLATFKPSFIKHLATISFLSLFATHINAEPLKALLIVGGGAHDYRTQSEIIPDQIDRYSKLDVEWTVHMEPNIRSPIQIFNRNEPEYPHTYSEWVQEEFDIVIFNLNHTSNDQNYINRILAPHQNGVPAMLIHGATISYGGLGGNTAWREFQGVRTSWRHGYRAHFDMEFLTSQHEILEGFGDWTTQPDEMYPIIGAPLPTLTPLAQARHPGARDFRMNTWTNHYQNQTRVFATTLGHFNANLNDPKFGELITRGFLWATENAIEENLESIADLPQKYEFEYEFENASPENHYAVAWTYSRLSASNPSPVLGWGVIEFEETGGWIRHPDVDFGSGAQEINIRYASTTDNNRFEIRTGSLNGPTIANITLPRTGHWRDFETLTFPIDFTDGVHDLYFVSTQARTANLDYFTLNITPENEPTPDTDTLGLWHMVKNDIGDDDGEIQLLNGAIRSDSSGVSNTDGLVFSDPDAAASIDGVDLEPNSSFTIEAWVNFESLATGSDQFIFNKWNNRLNRGYMLFRRTDGTWIARIGDGTNRQVLVTDELTVEENQWHHIALTWNQENQTLTLWIDGESTELAATETFNFVDYTNQPLFLGNDRWDISEQYHFNGRLDLLRISTMARTF